MLSYMDTKTITQTTAVTPETVTIVTMLLTGEPQGTIYGVYQGRLSFRKGQPHSFNLNKATRVGIVVVPKGQKADYLEIAKKFETPNFPAFSW